MGLGYIPYSEISSYLDEMKIDNWEDRILFRKMINFIDNAYLANENKKSAIKSAAKTPKSKTKR